MISNRPRELIRGIGPPVFIYMLVDSRIEVDLRRRVFAAAPERIAGDNFEPNSSNVTCTIQKLLC